MVGILSRLRGSIIEDSAGVVNTLFIFRMAKDLFLSLISFVKGGGGGCHKSTVLHFLGEIDGGCLPVLLPLPP